MERHNPTDRLTGAQVRAMFMIAGGERSEEVIGHACGVSPARVARWRKIPRFRLAVAAQRRDPPDPDERLKLSIRHFVTRVLEKIEDGTSEEGRDR